MLQSKANAKKKKKTGDKSLNHLKTCNTCTCSCIPAVLWSKSERPLNGCLLSSLN